jgi:hypothetical protein
MVHRTTDYTGAAIFVTNIMTSKSALVYERDLFTIAEMLAARLSQFDLKRTSTPRV